MKKLFTYIFTAAACISPLFVQAQVMTPEELKAGYIYTDFSKTLPAQGNNFEMLSEDKNALKPPSSQQREGADTLQPSSCVVSGKNFVNCRQ